MSAAVKTRGRPQVADKSEIRIGGEKITLSLIEGDEPRVQVSLPGGWAVSGFSGSAGRQRIDVVPVSAEAISLASEISASQPEEKVEEPKVKIKPSVKVKTQAKVSPEPESDIAEIAKAPAKRRGRPRKAALEAPFDADPAPSNGNGNGNGNGTAEISTLPVKRRSRKALEFSNN